MTSASLAEWSNLAVYASMLILIGALVAFAISFAANGQLVLTPSSSPSVGHRLKRESCRLTDPRCCRVGGRATSPCHSRGSRPGCSSSASC